MAKQPIQKARAVEAGPTSVQLDPILRQLGLADIRINKMSVSEKISYIKKLGLPVPK
jgi:hypothetical protein